MRYYAHTYDSTHYYYSKFYIIKYKLINKKFEKKNLKTLKTISDYKIHLLILYTHTFTLTQTQTLTGNESKMLRNHVKM